VSRLVDVVTASPPHVVDQAYAAEFARARFREAWPQIDRLIPLFFNTGIRSRHVCRPPEWYAAEHGLDEKNAAYIEAATDLCATAGRALLERRGLSPEDIDRVYYVNTTGLATPSIDARLINILGINRRARRIPVWGLGCAGGVAGLAMAAGDLAGRPGERALVFAAEMCSLTFLADDFSKSNLVATALFADGAAVALVSGDETGDPGYPILGSRSMLFPDSLDVMGWSVVARGLQVVFDQRIPAIIREHAAAELDALLDAHDLSRADVSEFLYHPGGPKVLQAYADAYAVEADRFHWSRDVFEAFGNMSSVTVLFVLARYLADHSPGRGRHAVVSALGPGFSSVAFVMTL
jgi:alkylresorcinol/alkylpyrone synthase